jgi:hypothetical protein
MKMLSGFILIHLKIFGWFFLAAGVVYFIDSTVVKMQHANIPLTVLLPFSQFFK